MSTPEELQLGKKYPRSPWILGIHGGLRAEVI